MDTEAPRTSQSTESQGSNATEQAARISREMVRLMRRLSGRGPTRARTTIGRDHVLVMFENTLTEGERNLVQNGHRDDVEALRRAYQAVLEAEASAMVAEVTGRRVTRFMSANQLDHPDAAAEIFLFEPDGAAVEQPREAEHREDDDES